MGCWFLTVSILKEKLTRVFVGESHIEENETNEFIDGHQLDGHQQVERADGRMTWEVVDYSTYTTRYKKGLIFR